MHSAIERHRHLPDAAASPLIQPGGQPIEAAPATASALHQAFAWGKATLAFQCHPEVRARDLEKWFVGHAAELSHTGGVNAKMLRGDTLRYGAALESQAKLCFGEWLDSLEL